MMYTSLARWAQEIGSTARTRAGQVRAIRAWIRRDRPHPLRLWSADRFTSDPRTRADYERTDWRRRSDRGAQTLLKRFGLSVRPPAEWQTEVARRDYLSRRPVMTAATTPTSITDFERRLDALDYAHHLITLQVRPDTLLTILYRERVEWSDRRSARWPASTQRWIEVSLWDDRSRTTETRMTDKRGHNLHRTIGEMLGVAACRGTVRAVQGAPCYTVKRVADGLYRRTLGPLTDCCAVSPDGTTYHHCGSPEAARAGLAHKLQQRTAHAARLVDMALLRDMGFCETGIRHAARLVGLDPDGTYTAAQVLRALPALRGGLYTEEARTLREALA